MERETGLPSAGLAAYFSAYHFIENQADERQAYPIKAGPKAALAFFLRGSFSLEAEGLSSPFPAAALIGPVFTSYRVLFPAGRSAVALAEFTEAGCYELLRERPGSKANAFEDLSGRLPGSELDALRELVFGRLRGVGEKLAALERVLSLLAAGRQAPSAEELTKIRIVERAVGRVKADVDEIGVAELAESIGVGERTLQRAFRAVTGLSPKRYIDLARFTKLFHLYYEDRLGFADAFSRSSYYDQSHVIKKFRQYSGHCPGEALARPFHFSSGLSARFVRELGPEARAKPARDDSLPPG